MTEQEKPTFLRKMGKTPKEKTMIFPIHPGSANIELDLKAMKNKNVDLNADLIEEEKKIIEVCNKLEEMVASFDKQISEVADPSIITGKYVKVLIRTIYREQLEKFLDLAQQYPFDIISTAIERYYHKSA